MSDPRDRYDLDFRELHDIIRPGEVRPSDKILARVRKSDGLSEYESLKVWRLSPLGVELYDSSDEQLFSKGDPVDLEITIDGQRAIYQGLVVDLIQENELIRLLGIRLATKNDPVDVSEDRRKSTRWICSDEFYPSAVCSSPGVVNDFTQFQVRDISAKGMQLVCSLRNKYLLAGRTVLLTTNFPMVGEFVAPVKIVRVGLTAVNGKDKLSLGVEFMKVTDHMQKTMAQYLIQFSNVETLEELRVAGFNPGSVSKAVDFYYLKSQEDYQSVLKLRLSAHQFDRNIKEDLEVTPEDMGDIEDTRSRIIVGMYRDRVVATGRVRFNELDSPLEHEKYIDWPADMPRRDEILEISRVCTDPEFRRGDLLAGLFQFACATCIQMEKPYVLIGSWPEMRTFYSKLGWKDTGLSHKEPMWKSEQHLMLGHSLDGMLGRGVNPIYWNLIWRVVADHTISNGLVEPSGMDAIRLKIYRMFGPLSQWLFNRRRKLRPRK